MATSPDKGDSFVGRSLPDDVAMLVGRATDGDEDAIASLVDHFRGMASGYAFGTVRDRWLAEDAMQIAFLEAYRNLRSIRDPARFGARKRSVTCVVLRNSNGPEVLMHQRGDIYLWSLPGGGVEDGETWECAAVRETYEETGLRVAIDRRKRSA